MLSYLELFASGQYFEDELVQGEKTYNPWALKCHRENLMKIGINVFEVSQHSVFVRIFLFIKSFIIVYLSWNINIFFTNIKFSNFLS